jgi:predicted nucleic acid-binding protein
VLFEVRKGARCNPRVADWWRGVAADELYLSALTLGEVRKGAESVRSRDPAFACALDLWLAALTVGFGARVLPVDRTVAEAWGRLAARRTIPVIDALMAATAEVHGLILATRNVRHVAGLGVRSVNPFDGG